MTGQYVRKPDWRKNQKFTVSVELADYSYGWALDAKEDRPGTGIDCLRRAARS